MRHQKHYELTSDQQIMVVDHMGYARNIVKKYSNRGVDTDDLEQEAFYALCAAAANYSPEHNTQFSTFATEYVRRRIERFIDYMKWNEECADGEVFEEKPIYVTPEEAMKFTQICLHHVSYRDDEDDELLLEDIIADPDSTSFEDRLDDLYYKQLAKGLLGILGKNAQGMVKCFFTHTVVECEKKKVWNKFGVSRQWYCYVVNRSVRRMADYAAKHKIVSPFSNAEKITWYD